MTPARRDRVFTARRSRRAIYVMRDNADPLDLSKGILTKVFWSTGPFPQTGFALILLPSPLSSQRVGPVRISG